MLLPAFLPPLPSTIIPPASRSRPIYHTDSRRGPQHVIILVTHGIADSIPRSWLIDKWPSVTGKRPTLIQSVCTNTFEMLRQGVISLQLGGSVLLVSYGQIKANPTSASKMEDKRGVSVADFVIMCHLVNGHDRSLLGRVNTAENNSGILHVSHRRVLSRLVSVGAQLSHRWHS